MGSKILAGLLIFSILLVGCSGTKEATKATSSTYVPLTYLGVNFPTNVNPNVAAQNNLGVNKGVMIGQIVSGGPADKAGLKVNDVITAVDGIKVTECNQLAQLIQLKAPGTQVNITYYRGTGEFNVTVTMVSRPAPTS